MPAINSTKLTIGNKTFGFNALIVNPDKYLPLMQPLFSAKVFAQKETETTEKYLRRLFGLLCGRQGMNVTSSGTTNTTRRTRNEQLSEEATRLINEMGIEIVKTNPKSLNVIFKRTGNKYRMKRDAIEKLIESVKKNVTFKHDKCSISIGVELEFVADPSKTNAFIQAMNDLVGSHRFDPVMSYHKNHGMKWELGVDGSVNRRASDPYGYRGYELTSPIFKLGSKKDMKELRLVCDLVKDVFGGRVNPTCGTHVHMSFDVDNVTDDLCYHFARSYRRNEDSLFDKVVPLCRRRNRARYSRPVNTGYLWDRYRKLNFCNVKKNTKNMHLEFRQLDGTLDFRKILTWCKLQKLFIELTLESWKEAQEDNTPVVTSIEYEDVIMSNEFDYNTVESLMKMGSIVA